MRKISIPDSSLNYEKDNLFNCNLNTLKEYFPIKGFPGPKDIKTIYDISYLLTPNIFAIYEQIFNNSMSDVDKYHNSKLYYYIMNSDLGLDIKPGVHPESMCRLMYKIYMDSAVKHIDADEVSEEEINEIIDNLYIYQLMADKNLSHAKDELKRKRLSVTAMEKRLYKSDKNCTNNNYTEQISKLVNYYRFVLLTYQQYIEDKTWVAKEIYKELLKLIRLYILDFDKVSPDRLDIMLKGIDM